MQIYVGPWCSSIAGRNASTASSGTSFKLQIPMNQASAAKLRRPSQYDRERSICSRSTIWCSVLTVLSCESHLVGSFILYFESITSRPGKQQWQWSCPPYPRKVKHSILATHTDACRNWLKLLLIMRILGRFIHYQSTSDSSMPSISDARLLEQSILPVATGASDERKLERLRRIRGQLTLFCLSRPEPRLIENQEEFLLLQNVQQANIRHSLDDSHVQWILQCSTNESEVEGWNASICFRNCGLWI